MFLLTIRAYAVKINKRSNLTCMEYPMNVGAHPFAKPFVPSSLRVTLNINEFMIKHL